MTGDALGEIPSPIAGTYRQLWQKTAYLYGKWNTYLKLYSSQDVIEVLNSAGRSFFGMHQQMAIADILLDLSKLTDKPGEGKKKNLSVQLLLRDNDTDSDPDFHKQLEEAVGAAITACAFAVPWRHRLIAHFDLATALNEHAEPLKSYQRNEVIKGIESLASVLNLVSLKYKGATTAFAAYEASDHGVDQLISLLRSALEHEREDEEG